MLRRVFAIVVLGVASLAAGPALGALTPQRAVSMQSGGDVLNAREYRLGDVRVAGRDSLRQSVTAWEVTTGSWNGERLNGLSLVLVQNTQENGRTGPTWDCYISHLATPAQRIALLSAFLAAQDQRQGDMRVWRIQPAVIRFEVAGKTVIVHLGMVA